MKLPDEHIFPVSATLLGYEDKAPDHRRGKLNDTGIVHYDTYKRLNDAQKEAIVQKVNDPKNHFWDQYGSGTYLEFFYTKWAAPHPAEMIKRWDDRLYDKLTSFIHK